jgi:hypothetical protein
MPMTRRAAITTSAIAAGLALAAGAAEAQPVEYPRLRAALRALDNARAELRGAPHDFGGHRDEAIRACDHAAEQIRLALDYRR